MLHRLASVRVETSDEGVLVANVIGRRHLEWAEIVGVRLLRDDAWMMLDLSDGQALAAMGVQKSEGKRAKRAGAGVRAARPGRTPRCRGTTSPPAGKRPWLWTEMCCPQTVSGVGLCPARRVVFEHVFEHGVRRGVGCGAADGRAGHHGRRRGGAGRRAGRRRGGELTHDQLAALVTGVRRAGARLESVTLSAVGEVDARGTFALDGALTAGAWLRQTTRVTAGEAAGLVRTARVLRCGLLPGHRDRAGRRGVDRPARRS